MTELTIDQVGERSRTVLDEVERAVVGKRAELALILLAVLADGHVLVEDYPGLAKTLVARSLAQVLDIGFARVQFTPDLLPADVTGSSVYRQADGTFEFRPGPVFANLLLADEINRAPPKTQSALLEAMAERQVTVEGETHILERPFLVIATQNPIEYEGTFALPEAQLDRFMLRIRMGYPQLVDEIVILDEQKRTHPLDQLEEVVSLGDLREMQAAVREIHVEPSISDYIVRLVNGTRNHPDVYLGASPRGSIALYRSGQALAGLLGRDYVIPDDIKALAEPALAHRLIIKTSSSIHDIGASQIVRELLETLPVEAVRPAVGGPRAITPVPTPAAEKPAAGR